MEIRIQSERLTAAAYREFLSRSDLGQQYPRERFETRIETLVGSVPISLTARDDAGLLVGVAFGITDFAYWLFLTDLGVDRRYTGMGIGTRLVKAAHKAAGGERDIALYLVANDQAIPFYEKLGMEKVDDVMAYNRIDWTPFTVDDKSL